MIAPFKEWTPRGAGSASNAATGVGSMGRQIESNGAGDENPWRASLAEARRSKDKRGEPRFGTKLRGGRIYDAQQRLICHCVVRDRSANGARLLLPKNVAPPGQICFFDEELKELFRAQVRWRQDREIGILKLRLVTERWTS